MAAFTWIQMSSLLILMLQFKGTTEQNQTVTAERGHDVTLPCTNVIQGQHNCYNTTWLFSDSNSSVALLELGQNKEAKPKSDRLSLSADCSLVIKKVTDQDVGRYTCRQFKTPAGSQEYSDFMIYLSVINNVKTTKSTTVTSTTKTSSTTKSTTSTIKPTVKITNIWTTRAEVKTSGVWLGFIIVLVGLVTLLIIVVVIIRWKKIKENKTQCGNNTGLSLNPADTQSGPGSSQDTADADDGVSYVSISFTKKSKNKSRSRGDDDEGDTVTYSTVKASSSPAGVSTDPNNLYSTINYPRK